MIRTLRENFNRRAAYLHRFIWIDYLSILVKRLNNTVSSVTGYKPSAVGPNEDTIIYHKIHDPNVDYVGKKPKFNLGDVVRISRKRNVFEKGTSSTFTKETFYIDKAKVVNDINVYYLTDMKNEPVIGAFYEPELVRVTQLKT